MKKEAASPEQMDKAAQKAKAAYAALSEKARAEVSGWFREHYLAAGHKRLGRILVKNPAA